MKPPFCGLLEKVLGYLPNQTEMYGLAFLPLLLSDSAPSLRFPTSQSGLSSWQLSQGMAHGYSVYVNKSSAAS